MNVATWKTSWGYFGIVADEAGIRSTYLPQPEVDLQRRIDRDWPEVSEDAGFIESRWPTLCDRVRRYFDGEAVSFDYPLRLEGTPPFRRRVLEACAGVAYGSTLSYAALGQLAGNARAARAVGGAMANNPLPLLVPCHRVLRADGSIGGFSAPDGVTLKARMLRLECVSLREQPVA